MTSWCILRCSGRSTLRLAQSLAEDGFECWTPVEVVRTVLPGSYHKRPGTYPLVDRYVFARARHDQDLLRLAGIRHRHPTFSVVMRGGRIGYVSDAAIELLREAEEMVEARSVPRKRISPYSRGAKVSVKRGAFAGMKGEVERSDGRSAEVWITMFGRHQRFEIPIHFLRDEQARKAA